jgi:hypothetical protein
LEVSGSFVIGGCVVGGEVQRAWISDGGVHGPEFESGFTVLGIRRTLRKGLTVCAAS